MRPCDSRIAPDESAAGLTRLTLCVCSASVRLSNLSAFRIRRRCRKKITPPMIAQTTMMPTTTPPVMPSTLFRTPLFAVPRAVFNLTGTLSHQPVSMLRIRSRIAKPYLRASSANIAPCAGLLYMYVYDSSEKLCIILAEMGGPRRSSDLVRGFRIVHSHKRLVLLVRRCIFMELCYQFVPQGVVSSHCSDKHHPVWDRVVIQKTIENC